MSLTNRQQAIQFLIEMKVGSVLTKREHNGEKYSRHFYLDKHERFVSYRHSERIFSQPTRCKLIILQDLLFFIF